MNNGCAPTTAEMSDIGPVVAARMNATEPITDTTEEVMKKPTDPLFILMSLM
jgi:hypothetical protein